VSLIPDPLILHGTEASPFEWPWMGSVLNNNRHRCGATLISNEWVVTAYHCVEYEHFVI